MNKKIFGLILGAIAGILDITPMVIQKLPWDANISAFIMWVVVGFLIASVNLQINNILKGIIIAFIVLSPCAVLIGWKEPFSLLPIAIMTIFLGSLLGFFIGRYK